MKRKRRTGLIIFSILVIIVVVGIGGIIHQRFDKTSTKTVRLGLVGTDSEPVWDNVRKRLKKQGINIEYVVFNVHTGYKMLENTDLKLSVFQHFFILVSY